MGLSLSRRAPTLFVVLGVAILLTVAACSPAADDTSTTTDEPTGTLAATADGATTTTLQSPTTTAPQNPTSTTTTRPATTSPTTSPSTRSSTTTTRPTTTTLAIPPGNKPPSIEIISPANLSSHIAVLNTATQRFGAAVSLSAVVSDPNGDDITVRWFSSDQGALGTGESIIATLSTGQFDSAQPVITARATDQWGVSAEASVQIIVWIPSDV